MNFNTVRTLLAAGLVTIFATPALAQQSPASGSGSPRSGTRLESVSTTREGGRTFVDVTANGPFPRAWADIEESPNGSPTIIVDIPGVSTPYPANTTVGANGVVRVTTSNRKTDPAEARITIYLEKTMQFAVRRTGNTMRVSIGGDQSPSSERLTSPAAATRPTAAAVAPASVQSPAKAPGSVATAGRPAVDPAGAATRSAGAPGGAESAPSASAPAGARPAATGGRPSAPTRADAAAAPATPSSSTSARPIARADAAATVAPPTGLRALAEPVARPGAPRSETPPARPVAPPRANAGSGQVFDPAPAGPTVAAPTPGGSEPPARRAPPAVPLPAEPTLTQPIIDPLKEVQVTVGAGSAFDFSEPTTRIALADDTLVRLNVVSPTEVLVTGLKAGRTTLSVWYTSGRRALYPVIVEPNLSLVNSSLRDIHPSLLVSLGTDGKSVILRGEVTSEAQARQARAMVEQLITVVTNGNAQGNAGPEAVRVVNLVRYPGSIGTPEDRLISAMSNIDQRIRVRRIQSGSEPSPDKDSYVLEGRVKDINSLVQAIVLAERQLGGTGTKVKSADENRVAFEQSTGNAGGGGGLGGGGGGGAMMLGAGSPPKNGLAAQAARGLLLTSESGRVVSFLQIDALPQVLVSVRVLQIDRNKFKRLGVNASFAKKTILGDDAFGVTTSMITGSGNGTSGSGRAGLGAVVVPPPTQPDDNASAKSLLALNVLGNLANLSGGYVDATRSFLAALDFLGEKKIARSVSEPNILTLSGEIASVLVGGTVPVPTTVANQVAVQTAFGFQQFGVRLDIRPTVDDQGVVALEVVPSIVSPTQTLGNGGVPGFRIQRVETTARVRNGESLVLGGLLSASEELQERRVPGLGWLPLFRNSGASDQNMELLFLITPKVVTTSSPEPLLPPLQFNHTPSRLGASGLDSASGLPVTMLGSPAVVVGKSGTCAELRSAATQTSEVKDCLVVDTEVSTFGRAENYYHVRTRTGQDGWIAGDRLRVTTEKP